MNARHVVDAQLAHASDVPATEVTETLRYAEHLEATVDRLDGGRRDDGIDARRWSASDDDRQRSRGSHGSRSFHLMPYHTAACPPRERAAVFAPLTCPLERRSAEG